MTKSIVEIVPPPQQGHWVGDGFPVRSLFSYHNDPAAVTPFLLFDYAGPWQFPANASDTLRGVGEHPHRGFETVTIVYDGEVSHADSAGGGGTIGAGDVQWMTAGAGIVHQEFHSAEFSRVGGPFRMVQLWVNLPAKDKDAPAAYQAITRDQIPCVPFVGGHARVIAGAFAGVQGPAKSFTPIELWDVRLNAGAQLHLPISEGFNAMIAVLDGELEVTRATAGAGALVRLSREGHDIDVRATTETMLLVLAGEPIDEPVAGHGPFVMNHPAEISQAMRDFQAGKFGRVTA